MRKTFFYLLLIVFTAACSFRSGAQIIKDASFDAAVELQMKTQMELAGNRSDKLFGIINETKNEDEKQAVSFLLAYLPLSDLADYPGSYFLENVRMSLKARRDTPWGVNIPGDVFFHFVLPVRVNNENLDDFRTEMYDEIMGRIKGMSMKDAALEVNHWCHEKVTYRPSDERTSAPLSTIRTSYGRCGEESTFFVAALRTAGIPARQVYTPRWAHTDDNHAWVEIWVDGKWYFLGACEPSPDLNMGWFAAPSTRTMLVNTRVFGKYTGDEPVVVSEKRFSEINRTGNYTPVKKIFVKVTDNSGAPVENAKVEFQLYNYAEFFPLARTYTNAGGFTGFTTGLGTLVIWANKNNSFGYEITSVKETDTVNIKIGDNFTAGRYEEHLLIPPSEQKINSVSEKDEKENSARLQKEDEIRNAYMKTFRDSSWAVNFLKDNDVKDLNAYKYITGSNGNWKEITSFIKNTPKENREYAVRLLGVISDKDLHDTKESVLKEHLDNSLNFRDKFRNNTGIWEKYILSGRISNEMMTAWRTSVKSILQTSADKAGQPITPAFIEQWIAGNIKTDNVANMHSRAPLSPSGVLETGYADNKSRDILFVASCRTFGIPARLNPITLVPQYLDSGDWKDVLFDAAPLQKDKRGYINLINTGRLIPKYYTNFTVGLFKEGVFRSLEFDEGKPVSQFPDSVQVPAGKYMLVTGNRKQDGSVLSGMSFFEVKENELTIVPVKIPEVSDEIGSKLNINTGDVVSVNIKTGKQEKLSDITGNESYVLAVIDPDKEPSKHLLNDILAVSGEFNEWGGKIILLVEPGFNADFINYAAFDGKMPNVIFGYDKDGTMSGMISKINETVVCSELPAVFLINKKGGADFFRCGYSIGSGEEILKILRNGK